ncbi:hypothetical protein [Spirosoma agri]|uniref:Uncharacterized protein n=1 Tax=Spirosoma agri TaxID=1987381 RepID=A0A6M0IG92_9BACT|nr:hypothetical protein [Spirosoma agri]NEU67306.1 hypothetical protein [Spirosoma agri]
MKTDRFADIIRRKLDSIRPDFSERDWVRMQATLKQAGPNPNMPTPAAHPFAGQFARYAVAGAIGTAIFLTTSIWQHYELNRLHQTLDQVTQKVNQRTATDSVAATTQTANRPSGAASSESVVHAELPQNSLTRPDKATPTEQRSSVAVETKRDTIYIDRYVTVPAPATRPRGTDAQPASQYERAIRGNRTAQADISATPARPENSAQNRMRDQTGKSVSGSGSPSPASTVAQQPYEGVVSEKLADDGTKTSRQTNDRGRVTDTYAVTESTGKLTHNGVSTAAPTEQTTHRNVSGAEAAGQATNRGSSGGNEANALTPDNRIAQTQPLASAVPPVTGSGEAAQSVAQYESLSPLPMQTSTIHWNELMAQRAKRMMRPARTTVVSGVASAAPAIQRVQPTPMRFRVGVGADIDSRIRSVGVYSELLVLKHWSLGVGLSQARFATNSFPGPPDFNKNNPQDFRKQYARGNDPRLAIFNIQQYSTRIQLPINLGYRIPLSDSWTLQPTVGTSLNLQNRQYISFYQELPYRMGFEELTANSIRPVDLFNNMTFGANVEWQRKHWVAQAGPLVTAPIQEDPGCQQNITVGLRARVLYQF